MQQISVSYVPKSVGKKLPGRSFGHVDQVLSAIARHRMSLENETHYMQIHTPGDLPIADLERIRGAGVVSSGAFLPQRHDR